MQLRLCALDGLAPVVCTKVTQLSLRHPALKLVELAKASLAIIALASVLSQDKVHPM